MESRARCAAAFALGGLLACSPALDWRDVSPQESGVAALFPCRPDLQRRPVVLGDTQVDMRMLVCSADGATFALSFFDVGEPARVTPALVALRASAVAHFADAKPQFAAVQVGGMTPSPEATRLKLGGRLPDGSLLNQQSVLFAHGARVYQASVVGAKPNLDAADVFFSGLRFSQ